MNLKYITNDQSLSANDFLDLAQDVWPGNYNTTQAKEALQKTINITAWDDKTLIGCARILSDGYFLVQFLKFWLNEHIKAKELERS
ncbi:hypothetical protein J31TS6_57500 [Brevibacillus reuszeri]|uniref:hypothetical protein n=1 Tax=Brevibacillus reuszeri TaxID=54915 RepID=UPI001B0AF271|nr:hypothetical protein [Brevibacillus reuszeri]GIO09722.1 hypothetical protein J31TS6_57500 [Brevibacillus reuszeri]